MSPLRDAHAPPRLDVGAHLERIDQPRLRAARLAKRRTEIVVCIETHIGEVGGAQGVKLEPQVRIKRDGPVVMSRAPIADALEV